MANKRAGTASAKRRAEKTRATSKKYRERARRGRVARRVILSAIVLAIAAMAVLLVVAGRSSSMSGAENVMGTVVTTVQSAFTKAAQGVRDFFTNWRDYDALEEEYDQLARDHEALSIRYTAIEELRRENARLTDLLGAYQAYEEYDPAFARVVAREAGVWFNTFTIDLGSSDGIKPGMPVLTAQGLVGRVLEVGFNYSKVLSIIDSRSAVAVLMQTTRDNGVMKGQITDGTGDDSCYVYYLPDMNSISPGDTVVTSGTDSQYPKGLVVGYVSAISMNETSLGTYAIVKPAVDFLHLEEVLVLRVEIESVSEQLPTVATPAPVYVTPTPEAGSTATPAPTGENYWYYPTATPQPAATGPITHMREDDWAED